jgi:hypothetical protein
MPSLEAMVKSQFEKVFKSSDWKRFKLIAESNLAEAAFVKSRQMRIADPLQLLARNSRKRLLIGVGVELLLKSIYLKRGFVINRTTQGNAPPFPFTIADVPADSLDPSQTFMLNDLIQKLPTVVQLQDRSTTVNGLRIAKVFRNKEGHCVTASHAFNAQDYVDIAESLRLLYQDAFNQELTVRFSMAHGERAAWHLA